MPKLKANIITKGDRSLDSVLAGGPMLMPVREITASDFGIKSSFVSDKSASLMEAESLLEHDFLTLLEWDRRVARYGTQPLSIEWIDERGWPRLYTPDVLVIYDVIAMMRDKSLRPTVFEVKTDEELRRDWNLLRPKFKAATSALRSAGIRFKIVTERHIRTPVLENARFLLSYKTTRFQNASKEEMAMQLDIRRALQKLGESTPRLLLANLSDDPQVKVRYIPWIWWLLNNGVIKADLTKRLTMSSTIFSNDTAKSIPGE